MLIQVSDSFVGETYYQLRRQLNLSKFSYFSSHNFHICPAIFADKITFSDKNTLYWFIAISFFDNFSFLAAFDRQV
jgi:hypothetical protein